MRPTIVDESHAASAATSLVAVGVGLRTIPKWRVDLSCWTAKLLEEDGGVPTDDTNEKD